MSVEPQAFGSGWLSALSDIFEPMFDSFELPPPEAVAGLDELGLLDTKVASPSLAQAD
jgi:hypothetical protein